MPFQSEAQRRKFRVLLEQGKISQKTFDEWDQKNSRILIVGSPKAGKTTLSNEFSPPIQHTDDLISYGWSEASEEIASKWMKVPGPWVIEGVATVRALRKFMVSSQAKPCDYVIYMPQAHPKAAPLMAGQIAMAKGIQKIWTEIEPQLKARGIEIIIL